MHPRHAARLIATFGAVLIGIVLILRLASLVNTIYQLHLQAANTAPEGTTSAAAAPALGQYVISSDGEMVTFLQQTDTSGKTAWFRMPVKGGNISPASQPTVDFKPFLLRNGRLFLQSGDGYTTLVGTSPDTIVGNFALAPDHKSVAFAGYHPDGQSGIFIFYINGQIDWLGDVDGLTDLAWTPDGKSLAFVGLRNGVDQVFSIDTAGVNLKQLTGDATQKSSPVWSPDGKAIAYLSAQQPAPRKAGPVTPTPDRIFPPTPLANQASTLYQLNVIDGEGSQPRLLISKPQPIFNLSWVNNGQEIAYAQRDAEQPQVTQLYAVNVKDMTIRRAYPPYAIIALTCPAHLPRDGTSTVKLTIANSSLMTAGIPVLIRSGAQAFPVTGPRNTGNLQGGTLQVPPGGTNTTNWVIPASAGLVTNLSAVINIGPTYPMAEAHCAMKNTYNGLPNLSFLPPVLPLTAVGMLLFLPWLRHQKRRLFWIAWALLPVIILILIGVEIRFITLQ